jgi:hypothetical protein
MAVLWIASMALLAGGCCLCPPRELTIEEEARLAAKGDSGVLNGVRYRNRSRHEDADEAAVLADRLMAADPTVFTKGTGLDLRRCYDAVKTSSTEGVLTRLPGSYAGIVLGGETNDMLMHVPYVSYRVGKYIAVCRLRSAKTGKLCTIDLASGPKAFGSVDVEVGWRSRGTWREVPISFELKKQSRVEIRILGKGVPMAVDRLYVFKVRKIRD